MSKKVLLIDPPSGRILEPPFGSIPALAGALRARGHQVLTDDLNITLFDEIFSERTAEYVFNVKKRRMGYILAKDRLNFSWLRDLRFRWENRRMRNSFHAYLPKRRFPGRSLRSIRNRYRYLTRELSFKAKPIQDDEDYLDAIDNREFNYFYQLFSPYLRSVDWQDIDVVGITINRKSEIPALSLAREIREIAPHVRIVLGGPLLNEVDFNNEFDLTQLKNILERRFADFLVIYEGETALLSILDQLSTNGSMHAVPNLIWLEDGQIVINRPFHFEKINELSPISYDGFPVDWYPGLSVEVSRGCYWAKCVFCTHCYLRTERSSFSRNAPAYRCADPRKVVESIRFLKEKFGHFYFDFACLDVSPPEMDHLCEEIIASNVDIGWAGRLRLEQTFKPGLLDKMAQAGASYFHLAPETLTQRTADLHEKGYNIEHIKGLLEYWEKNRNRLPPMVINMFTGFPGETLDDFRETFEYIGKGRFFVQDIHLWFFAKHSRIFYDPGRYGLAVQHVPKNKQLFSNFEVEFDPDLVSERNRIRHFLEENEGQLKNRQMWPNYLLSENDWKWSRVK